MSTGLKVIVVGAGIVGVSCAIWLRRDGHEVTLVDRAGPAAETSYGNAGLLASVSSGIQYPGLTKDAIKMLLLGGPLFLDWRRLARLAPWFRRFAARINDRDATRITRDVTTLARDSIEQHRSVAADSPAARFIGDGTWLHLFKAETPPESWGYRRRRENGGELRAVNAAELRELDPPLNPEFRSAWALERTGRVSDPGAYVAALAASFQATGGVLRIGAIDDVRPAGDGVEINLRAANGAEMLTADRAVIAAGVWSEAFARRLGVKGHVIPERGYHVEYFGENHRPPDGVSYYNPTAGHVLHGLAGRLRVTSISEPSSIDAKPNPRAQAYVNSGAERIYPDFRYESRKEWMGRRPTTPDSLPLLGPLARAPQIFFACGHQHLGLTMGPKSGRLIADLISGRRPNIDLAPFAPERFS